MSSRTLALNPSWFSMATALSAFLLAMDTTAQAPVHYEPLFFVERSTNTNIVQYDARVSPNGELCHEHPVVGYWILRAQQNKRESLSFFERQFAYGYAIEPAADSQDLRLILKARPQHAIWLHKERGHYRAETMINGRRAHLTKIYVHASAGLLPHVRAVDLLGRDPVNGELRSERVLP